MTSFQRTRFLPLLPPSPFFSSPSPPFLLPFFLLFHPQPPKTPMNTLLSLLRRLRPQLHQRINHRIRARHKNNHNPRIPPRIPITLQIDRLQVVAASSILTNPAPLHRLRIYEVRSPSHTHHIIPQILPTGRPIRRVKNRKLLLRALNFFPP